MGEELQEENGPRELMRKCPRCQRYTLSERCPECGEKTVSPHPPKHVSIRKFDP